MWLSLARRQHYQQRFYQIRPQLQLMAWLQPPESFEPELCSDSFQSLQVGVLCSRAYNSYSFYSAVQVSYSWRNSEILCNIEENNSTGYFVYHKVRSWINQQVNMWPVTTWRFKICSNLAPWYIQLLSPMSNMVQRTEFTRNQRNTS